MAQRSLLSSTKYQEGYLNPFMRYAMKNTISRRSRHISAILMSSRLFSVAICPIDSLIFCSEFFSEKILVSESLRLQWLILSFGKLYQVAYTDTVVSPELLVDLCRFSPNIGGLENLAVLCGPGAIVQLDVDLQFDAARRQKMD
jgi:hypothetical protein